MGAPTHAGTGQAARARALVAHGRGLLAVDQPCLDVHAALGRARIGPTEVRCRELRELALTTPGLDRVVNGVLAGPGLLRATAARHGSTPLQVGVRMHPATGGAADLRMDVPMPGDLDRRIAGHAADGASFARLRLRAGTGDRAAATSAAACQRGGLVPLLDCEVETARHDGFAQAEHAHTAALTLVIAELRRAGVDLGALLLGVRPVVPGRRCSQVDASDDVAVATARSLREAGACGVAGVVFGPPRRDRLAAHLAAVAWRRPGLPIGYCLGETLLAPVAAVWRGRPRRVPAAQHELRGRFTTTSAVLRAASAGAAPAPVAAIIA
jgi:fructose-bisphosphate aldolase, class I